ncbi:pentatricopeptide repeat-containing protein 1, mitochondrial isoform X2 [Salmo trutta]|uniref:Pentatricopeptide repeat domain 1 n=1 Tax=Salmo trutta TaxID=8032 RepID=A0A674D9I7_SALTR|nr:pentatricopeptide repeat-containing protein 1, mitochondrial-like isoform X2 [Salmo trutta]
MLQCVSRSCLRNGRSIVDYVVRYGSTATARGLSSLGSGSTVRAPRSWSVHPVTDINRRAFTGSVSVSSRRTRDVQESPAAPARMGRAGSDLGDEDFGSLSADFSSRRAFRKTTPELQEMLYREERQAAGQEEEREPVAFRSWTGRRNTQYWYFLQCKRLIKENKLSEALSMFQSEMLEGERLQPEEYNYTVLIGGCGRAGHLKQAFKLYNDMKKRGLVPSDATYTALFNACAESPRKQAGLQQAIHLEQELRRKNRPLSNITYHALLKTHALTNHLRACLHTLRVYRQMLRMGIRPDVQNYNLLLRAARDCGIGNPAVASALLLTSDCGQEGQAVKVRGQGSAPLDVDALESQLFTQHPDHDLSHHSNDASHRSNDPSDHSNDPSNILSYHSDLDSSVVAPVTTQLVMVRKGGEQEAPFGSFPCLSGASTRPPNLLDLSVGRAGEGGVVSLGVVCGMFDKLALMGGAQGFLDKMATAGLCPDIRTLTLLADTMEPGSQSLHRLLAVAKQHGVKLDAAFYNSVIRRAARAGDLQEAKAVMRVMQERHVRADVRTYGSLALGCNRQTDALQLLGDMQAAGVQPTVQVFSALIGCASRRLDYVYLRLVLRAMREHNVPPNDIIITQLEHASQYPPNYNQYKFRNTYLSQIDGFRGYYHQWLNTMPAQETGGPERDHPTETRQDGHQQAAAARRYRKQHS